MIADTTTTSSYAGSRTITAFFDSRADADRAVERVIAAGVSRSEVSVRAGADSSTTTTTTTRSDDNLGFWDSLKDLFLPDDDRATYAEGLRRGGYLVTVRASDAHVERVVDILDDEGTVNIDERAESWRSEGWTGYAAGATSHSAASAAPVASRTGYAATGSTTATGTLRDGNEETIAVTEEQLRVGKREVAGGRIRVRSYVVETPVEEQVSLRKEHVHVERHAVDRPVTGTEDAFRERVIEAEERSEEAVISKEARVVEELTIRKDAEQTTRTVSDTVRRTEVEVEDDRTTIDRSSTVTGTRDGNKI